MQTTVKPFKMSEIKTENRTKDKKVNRQFYTLYFMNPLNPLAAPLQRNVFQQHINDEGKVAVWKGGDPAIVKAFIDAGGQIPGKFMNCDVTPYEVNGRMVKTFPIILLDGEKVETILKQNNKELSNVVTNVFVAAEKGTHIGA